MITDTEIAQSKLPLTRFWKIKYKEEGFLDLYIRAETSDGAYNKLCRMSGPVRRKYLVITEIAESEIPEGDEWL